MQIDESPAWDDLRVLLALHRHRSFLAAGRALGVSTSTAARRIEALEAALGRPLVHRSTGGTAVEPAALELVALAEQLELGLRAVKRDEGEDAIRGTVRVSMGEGFVGPVTQVLSELRRKHPSLWLEVVAETRHVDLARREADVAIRKGKSSSPAVVERAVGRIAFGLYAAQSYIERRLRTARLSIKDFGRHDFVAHEGALAKLPQTQWLVAHGATRFVFRSNSDHALLEAAAQGQGLCMLPDPAARAVQAVIRVDVDADLPSAPVYLAYHRELRNVPRVRLVIDTLTAALRDGLR